MKPKMIRIIGQVTRKEFDQIKALAEAIRLGATYRKRTRFSFIETGTNWKVPTPGFTEVIASCALGAAYEGTFGKLPTVISDEERCYIADLGLTKLEQEFPILNRDVSVLIFDEVKITKLRYMIEALNDEWGVKRRAIADQLMDVHAETLPAESGE